MSLFLTDEAQAALLGYWDSGRVAQAREYLGILQQAQDAARAAWPAAHTAAAAEVDSGGAIAISEGDPVCLSDKGDVIWVCAWVEVPVTAPGGAV